MSKLSELKKKWLKDNKVRKAYDALSLEFAIAQKLISERLKAHLTQKEIAKRMGTTQSVIARIESGTRLPSMKTIECYAHALGKFPEVRFRPYEENQHTTRDF